jgi:hypothetical protein
MRRTLIAVIALAIAILLASCLPTKPPVVTPPVTPPVTCGLVVHVFNGPVEGDHKVIGSLASVAGRSAIADGSGNVTTLGQFGPGRYLVSVSAAGYLPVVDLPVELCAATSVNVVLTRKPPDIAPLPRLVTRGQFFGLETGRRFTAIQASDFNLLARFLANEDIEPVLKQRADAGFNMLRVWTLMKLDGIGTLLSPDYSRIPAFLLLCAKHGLYVEFTAYTSTFDDGTHWRKLVESVAGQTGVLLELVNENDQPANTIDTNAYARPVGVLASHGSNGSEAWPVEPYWDYVTFHTNGAFEEQRKIAHNGWEIWSGATLVNETSRYPEVGMWRRDDPARNLALAYDAAAGAALLAAGSCFHSVLGKTSQVWDAPTLAVAKAWAAGARSVPLHCQAGPYYHRAELETPDLLRVYQRGDDPVCIVKIRN